VVRALRRRGGQVFVGVSGGAITLAEDVDVAPVEVWRRPGGLGTEAWDKLALGDIDGDGDIDIAYVHALRDAVEWPWEVTLETFRGDGLGGFSTASVTKIDGVRSLALGDVDGDGILDAVGVDDGIWVSARGFMAPT